MGGGEGRGVEGIEFSAVSADYHPPERKERNKKREGEKEKYFIASWHRTIMFSPSHHQMAAAQSSLPGSRRSKRKMSD